MGWLVRCHHILTRIPAMATPQTFQNPETKTSPYVTETRQTSRDRYVLPFTSTSKPPMSTSNQQHHQQHQPATSHQQQPAAASSTAAPAAPPAAPAAPAATSSSNQQQPATSSSETRREGAVPPPEASTRCLRVASGVIHYMKPNERRGILVDENVRHPSCLVILLQYCNIMIYE